MIVSKDDSVRTLDKVIVDLDALIKYRRAEFRARGTNVAEADLAQLRKAAELNAQLREVSMQLELLGVL